MIATRVYNPLISSLRPLPTSIAVNSSYRVIPTRVTAAKVTQLSRNKFHLHLLSMICGLVARVARVLLVCALDGHHKRGSQHEAGPASAGHCSFMRNYNYHY
jgi:hypothetical protein